MTERRFPPPWSIRDHPPSTRVCAARHLAGDARPR